jgi:hypothetical protein
MRSHSSIQSLYTSMGSLRESMGVLNFSRQIRHDASPIWFFRSMRHSTLLSWLQNGQPNTVASFSWPRLGAGFAALFRFPIASKPRKAQTHISQATQPPLLTTLSKTNSHGNTAPPTIAKWRATEDTELGKWLKWEARTLIGFAARASLPLSPPELRRGAWIVRG